MRKVLAAALATLIALAFPCAAPAADETTHVHADPQHTGAVLDSPLRPPLRIRWQANLGEPWSNTVVAGGRVFWIHITPSGDRQVTALDVATGGVLWSQPAAPSGGQLAVDGGRLFVVTRKQETYEYGVRIRALDVATGAERWRRDLDVEYGPAGAPTAAGGQVFVLARDYASVLHGFRASDGADLWAPKILKSGGDSAPALSGESVFVSVASHNTYAFDRVTGEQRWHSSGCCTGGGGIDPILHGGRLYGYDSLVHDPQSGEIVGNWAGYSAYFAGDGGVQWAGPGLRGFGPDIGTTRWTNGDDFSQSLLIAGQHIYGTGVRGYPSSDQLRAVRLSDGATTWCTRVPVLPGRDGYATATVVAAGGGALLVASGGGLVAYENGGAESSCSAAPPPPGGPGGSGGGTGTGLPVTPVAGPSVGLRVGRTKLALGERTRVDGLVAGLPSVRGLRVGLELDEWPFDGRWRLGARATTSAGGTFAFTLEPRRNVRVRARVLGGSGPASAPVDVFADFPSRVRILGARGPRPRIRWTVHAFPRAQIRRKVVHAYLARGRTEPYRLVSRRRFTTLGRRSASATLPFPRGRLGRRDVWLLCVPERVPDGFGRASEIERRCGASTLPRGLS